MIPLIAPDRKRFIQLLMRMKFGFASHSAMMTTTRTISVTCVRQKKPIFL